MSENRSSPHDFESATQRAADTMLELKRLGAQKLSKQGFLQETNRISNNPDPARVSELRKLIDSGDPTVVELARYVKKIAKLYAQANWSAPFDPLRCIQIYGTKNILATIQYFGHTANECNVLSATLAVEESDDASFGTGSTPEEMSKNEASLLKKLNENFAAMRDNLRLSDLIIDDGNLLPEERRGGLIRITFRAAPNVFLNDSQWPRRLAERALSCDPQLKTEAVKAA